MQYDGLLETSGKHVLIGLTTMPFSLPGAAMLFTKKTITGSLIGGAKATQDMIDFCCAKNIYPEIEVIGADKIVDALKALDGKNDSLKRYVIDCSTIPGQSE
jgi:D-arabinose 1-dehydrogenase-like Zn-dependent alcohol dehydrogenase